jgi:hypothetical protein
MSNDLRARIERAVGMHLRPDPETPPHPDEIAIVNDVMVALKWSPDAKKLRAARNLHRPYRAYGPTGDRDWCEHCNRLTGGWVEYPCETIQAIGGSDE